MLAFPIAFNLCLKGTQMLIIQSMLEDELTHIHSCPKFCNFPIQQEPFPTCGKLGPKEEEYSCIPW